MSSIIQSVLRLERRLAELGTRTPCCFYCGEMDPAVLQRRKGHHPTGRQRDPDFSVIVCFNCHYKGHDRLEDARIPMSRENCSKDLMKSRLLGLAVHHLMVADANLKEAETLERWAEEL